MTLARQIARCQVYCWIGLGSYAWSSSAFTPRSGVDTLQSQATNIATTTRLGSSRCQSANQQPCIHTFSRVLSGHSGIYTTICKDIQLTVRRALFNSSLGVTAVQAVAAGRVW